MRTGMFALGCFPFILAFGAKWNLVGFVVGCSHEKLQVFHQWLSHLFRESLVLEPSFLSHRSQLGDALAPSASVPG